MKNTLTLVGLGCIAMAQADLEVIPSAYASTPGTGTFIYAVTTARTYQYIINENQLTGFLGENLNGLAVRSLASATNAWPPVDASFGSFEILIGQSVAPANVSNASGTAGNFVGTPTLVRSGALSIPAGSYGFGGTPVNPFGPLITFNNYLYTGGHLGIELRHTGLLGTTTTRSFDALTTSTAGYGTDFAAKWVGNGAGTGTLSNGNFFVTQLSSAPVPEPASLFALGLGATALLRRKARRKIAS